MPKLNSPQHAGYLAALKQRKRAESSKWESLFALHLQAEGLPPGVREHRFCADAVGWLDMPPQERRKIPLRRLLRQAGLRDFRFDFAWPDRKIAVEIDGAIAKGGRGGHTSIKGYTDDRLKDCEAVILGWTVIRVTGHMVKTGYAINVLSRLFKCQDQEATTKMASSSRTLI